MDSLPPDPYKALGVSKDADLAAIRSAHRKLVLKCHPDKVQDPELKLAKQDEFQAVQQAYELLSDDKKRMGYDEKVKLFELRREMGRGNPTARSNPFEYEVRTAEPRSTSVPYSRPPPKVYSHPPPRSYEDVHYEEPRAMPRKTAAYEERKRTSTREEERERDRRRYEEDEYLRAKAERRSEKSAHSDKKKSRDKEKRRGTEEKTRFRATAAEVEDYSDDEYRAPPRTSERRTKQSMEEEIRIREDAARAEEAARIHKSRERERPTIKAAPLDQKWDGHLAYSLQYMQAARRKGESAEFRHPGMPPRAETFAAPQTTYNIRYATPQQFSDEETPRRSSATRKEGRRSSDTPAPRASSRTREKSKSSRRSPATSHPQDPYIVEPPSPTPMKPSLQSYSSAPPQLSSHSRKEPSRSRTQDNYARVEKPPPLPRAQTFSNLPDRGRDRGGSRLKQQVYTDSDSEADSPIYISPRHSASPPPRRAAPEPTRYIIDNGRSVPIKSRNTDHRSELRGSDNDPYIRERSESPRAAPSRHQERPSLPRQNSDRARAVPIRSQSQNYYPPDPPRAEPIIMNAQPTSKMSSKERGSHRVSPRAAAGPFFGEVNYGPNFGQGDVVYANPTPANGPPHEHWRRGSDPSHHRGGYDYPRSGRELYT